MLVTRWGELCKAEVHHGIMGLRCGSFAMKHHVHFFALLVCYVHIQVQI